MDMYPTSIASAYKPPTSKLKLAKSFVENSKSNVLSVPHA